MEKIVVMSCTNRPNSNTLKVSRIYEKILLSKKVSVKILDFSILPHNIAFSETFGSRTDSYNRLIAEYVSSARKFIFVVPEYNGSFPGILKIFLDSVPPSEWHDKDACLVGIADGRAGNLRGLDHLTGILGYLKMHVYHDKLPISNIVQMLDDRGEMMNVQQLKACTGQVEGFLKF
jgi:chromate reductase, NAD(P)H dehydrogenase (quinone)